MSEKSLTDLHGLTWTALMAALVAAGAFLIVPIGPLPVSLHPLFGARHLYRHGLLPGQR
ncbi:hypothetical protein [Pseudodesulfovibrio sp.]|uniref:hypothetical protein n=1 Tax=unclassified Pseudodesulfovibrio TaxID=2661612 RepID=UPI003B00D3E8